MKLLIVHNHFRPGGVRRVIELATPHLAAPRVDEVVLVGGEAPDAAWLRHFKARLAPLPVTCRTDPALNYLAEQRRQSGVVARRLRSFFDGLFRGMSPGEGLVWAHNQGLGRNLPLTRELVRACAARGATLVFHHHDWWFDNRWTRWAEMRRAGFRTLAQAAGTVFASGPNVRHVAINQADAAILERHFHGQSGWVPNPTEPAPPLPATRGRRVRRWLREELGDAAPVWLVPCRLLRRKNIAEALLLARWLRPEAWLVTTGGVSSADEQAYARRLEAASRRHGWRLRLGILQEGERTKPSVPELLAASEAVVLTSLQEGFGLPYLEAAAARRPLIARALPNIAPDLARFGFRFPHSYDDLRVAPALFDWLAEQRRQRRLFDRWLAQLPEGCRRFAVSPALLSHDTPRAVPFSRLTLTAQLEVLAHPPEESWKRCAPLNPFLRRWREFAERRALRVTAWPCGASRWLSGHAYARRFGEIVRGALERSAAVSAAARRQGEHLANFPCAVPSGVAAGGTPALRFSGRKTASLAAQREFIRRTLRAKNLYPLTWNSNS